MVSKRLEYMISGSYMLSTFSGMMAGQVARDSFGRAGDILHDSMSMYCFTAFQSYLFLNISTTKLGRILATTVPPAIMTVYEFASKLDNEKFFFYDEKDIVAYWSGSLTSLLVNYIIQRRNG